MGLIVNTNLFSMNAQRNVGRTQRSLGTSIERLSSGLRINSAKDDAAGMAISMNYQLTSEVSTRLSETHRMVSVLCRRQKAV